MPSITLVPQANGHWQHGAIVGAASAWQAVATSDDDTSYLRFTTSASVPTPRASFHFHGCSNLRPTSVTFKARHRETTAEAQAGCGFTRHVPGSEDPDMFEDILTSSVASMSTYSTTNHPYTVHPFTGAAWRAGDLNGMEALFVVSKHPLSAHPVVLRLTYLEVVIVYDEPTFYEAR